MTAARDRLLELVKDRAVVHGRVTLSSGAEADYYVDLRRVTLDGEAAPPPTLLPGTLVPGASTGPVPVGRPDLTAGGRA